MPGKYRLTRDDFARLRVTRRIGGEYFLLAVAGSAKRHAQFACVVSKKVAARANVRNAIKRRCREIARAHLARVQKPVALIFYAKRSAALAPFSAIKRDIEQLLSRT